MSHNNVFLNSKYASGFSPQVIPGLTLWLDAADRSTLTLSGSNITQWRDKSPNAFTVSNNGSNPPGTVLGAQFNNLPVVSFPSNSQMNVTMAIPNSTTRSLFYVARASSAGSSFVMPLGSLSTNGNESYFIPNATSTNFNALDMQGTATTCSFTYTGGSTQDTVFMLGAVAGTAGTINGNTQSITSSSINFATGSITYTIGRSLYTRTWELGEMILFNVNLDTAQRRQVEGYLAWKWGLVGNLPTAHPYRTAPLFTRPFNPLDIAGCALWLDAADYRTFTFSSGSNVSQWNDKSGNGLNFSTTTGTVTYSNQGLITFPSGGAVMTSVSNFSLTSNTYVFAVARLGDLTGLPSLIDFSSIATGGWNGFFIRYVNIGILHGVPNNPGNVSDFGNGNYYVNGSFQPSFTSEVYAARHIVSGQSTNAGGSTAVTISSLFFGRVFIGDVHEILFYSSPPSTPQRQQIENYLAEKWGLRSSLSTSNALRLFRALSPVFNPTLISNCSHWFDAADSSVVELTSGVVSQWRDKSGLANNATQATSNARPLYRTLNSRPAVVFGGLPTYTATFMRLSNITSVPISIFMVATSTENLRNTFYISLGVFPNAIYVRELFDPIFFGVDGGSGGQYTSTVRDLNPHIWSFTLPASASGVFALDGTVVATSGFTLGANTTFTNNSLGTWNQEPTNGNVRGGISEAIIINRALSTADRQQVEGYLAWKWGLVGNLPSAHPYKSIKP